MRQIGGLKGAAVEDDAPRDLLGAGFGGAAGSCYELGELLGRGGMGEVYAAYEPRLRRRLAVKLLRGDEPAQVERFLREARAQAGIEHPAVCKVFGVGHLGGRPYIAMQRIDGEPLYVVEEGIGRPGRALGEMTLEQKLQVMRQVAEGIHAAHRRGVVHRDLKPSNVMVERGEDGAWRPYVLDFGLAREVAAQGVTSLGLAVGTPSFMAPEQVPGLPGLVDRRTDVYGLGATLYALVAGRPPFEAASSLDVLVKVTEEEAPPLSHVPRDVAAIVQKCLEKEPSRRYDSARAVAEDIGRYLDGEPVRARPTGVGRRLWKKARKHRALVSVSAVALAVIATLGAASVRAGWQARERARLANTLGQEVKAIESSLRIAHLVPLHDIRKETARVRRRMERIAAIATPLGALAAGPAHYALGRGYLALEEPERARDELAAAWSAGYREPEVAYALGQALGALYRRQLESAEQIRDDGKRQRRIRQLESELRDPALAYLAEAGTVEEDSPTYAAALVAFYEKRYDEALERSRAAYADNPSLYEARKLEGDVLRAEARQAQRSGDPQVLALYDRTEAAYREAATVGRSAPEVYEALCQLGPWVMELASYGRGEDVRPRFDAALAACDQALAIDPDRAPVYRIRTEASFRLALDELDRGKDALATIERAIAYGREAVARAPHDGRAHLALGDAYLVRASYAAKYGEDPRPHYTLAVASLERAIEAAPRLDPAYNDLGIAYCNLGRYTVEHGGDPRQQLERSVEAYRSAIAIDRESSYPYINLGVVEAMRARYAFDRGDDPLPAVDAAVTAYDQAIRLNPQQAYAYNNKGVVLLTEAHYELTRGRDPGAALRRCQEALGRSIDVNPRFSLPLENRASAHLLAAEHLAQRGGDPRPEVRAALQDVERCLAIDRDRAIAWQILGESHRATARQERSEGADPGPSLARAIDAFRTATEKNPQLAPAYRGLGDAFLDRAAYALEARRDPVAELRRAEEALGRSQEVSDSASDTYVSLARLRLLEARSIAGDGAAERYDQARAALGAALERNPRNLQALLLRGELERRSAEQARQRGRFAAAEVQTGLAAVDQVLALHPGHAEALALRGVLLLLQAAAEPVEAPATHERAVDSLRRALATNANLRHDYSRYLGSESPLPPG